MIWNNEIRSVKTETLFYLFITFLGFFSITWLTHKERLRRPSFPVVVYSVGSPLPSFVILLEYDLIEILIVFSEMMFCSYLTVTHLELINTKVIAWEHLCCLPKGKKNWKSKNALHINSPERFHLFLSVMLFYL